MPALSAGLHQQYLKPEQAGERPPSTCLHTLEEWSRAFRWQERVRAWDNEVKGMNYFTDYEALRYVQQELARRLRDTPEQFTTPELVALAEALIGRIEQVPAEKELSDRKPPNPAVHPRMRSERRVQPRVLPTAPEMIL